MPSKPSKVTISAFRSSMYASKRTTSLVTNLSTMTNPYDPAAQMMIDTMSDNLLE